MTILVTGGSGFIGSNFIFDWFEHDNEPIVNLDNLTYAAAGNNLSGLHTDPDKYFFVHGNICDESTLLAIFETHDIRAIVNFAAESHVDRSIDDPELFLETNVVGTYRLLAASHKSWRKTKREAFRFVHVSTDEVFGTLKSDEKAFTETHRYLPNSPYAASKASSDHIVRAFNKTYGLPTIISNCSNNYGPFQFPEKLIPLMIHNALREENLPIYGDGGQIRDWLYVKDHCKALRLILDQGKVGETYNVGGNNEIKNIDLVNTICSELDFICPRTNGKSYADLIMFVRDRPGHDRRYAINSEKIQNQLGWGSNEELKSGIRKTIKWYLENQDWLKEAAASGASQKLTRDS